MENVLKLVQREDTTTSKEDEDKKRLIFEIKEVCRLIACNEHWFELESDENLIEACIYERSSLYSRYRYLMKLAKKLGVSCNPLKSENVGV